MVVIGLGFVIFIHELGHFAVAKWAGVKVDKFSIGFGPSLIGFQRGETYYSISAIPLGGFVKMLGENPAEDGQEATTDPRSYLNKPVGARMAIISAGVIMNLITGLGFFAFAYRFGVPYMPAVVGYVVPGAPAYESGIRAGDEITAIDGQKNITFEDFLGTVSTSSHGQSVRLDMKRAETGEAYNVLLTPAVRPDRLKPEVGIGFPADLKLGTPAFDPMPGTASGSKVTGELKAGDRITAVASATGDWVNVDSNAALALQLSRFRSEPVRVKVVASEGTSTAPREATIPPASGMGLGLSFEAGPVASVQPGSPADKAGIKKGEKLVAVDGKPVDPRTLPGLAIDAAGKELKLSVADESGKTRDVALKPRLEALDPGMPGMSEFQDVPSLGLCYFVQPKIVAVQAGSDAEKAGLKAGQIVAKVKLKLPEPPAPTGIAAVRSAIGKAIGSLFPKPEDVTNTYQIAASPNETVNPDSRVPLSNIMTMLRFLDNRPIPAVELTIAGVEKPISLTPKAEPGLFLVERGLGQLGLIRDLPPQPAGVCLSRALSDIPQSVRQIVGTIKALVSQRVSRKLLGGPVTIATQAFASASEGMGLFLKFLGLLSVNLAVMNFLPIPPLDGGQMCFLIGEKLRGKPLPESFQAAFTFAGLFAVLSLMATVLYQDLLRVIGLL